MYVIAAALFMIAAAIFVLTVAISGNRAWGIPSSLMMLLSMLCWTLESLHQWKG